MSNGIIKKIAKGLINSVGAAEKDAYEAAAKIVKGMDKEVLDVVNKNKSKIGTIIEEDVKANKSRIAKSIFPNEVFGAKEYINHNSFQNLQSVENAVGNIKKDIVEKTSNRFITKEMAEEAYDKVSHLNKFDTSTQVNAIKDYAYNTMAEKDEVFKRYYDSYKSSQNAIANLGYKVDESTKKEIFADRMRLDYAAQNKGTIDGVIMKKDADVPINKRINSLTDSSDTLEDMWYNAYNTDKEFNVEQATRRAQESTKSSMDEAINNKKNKKKTQTFEEYTTNKYDEKFNKSWKSYSESSGEEREKFNTKFGIEDEEEAKEKIKEYYNKQKEGGGAFGIGDKLGYYKVPQKAVGIGATAWLVSNMCSSRGQLDNSQLYSQQMPYQNGGMRM